MGHGEAFGVFCYGKWVSNFETAMWNELVACFSLWYLPPTFSKLPVQICIHPLDPPRHCMHMSLLLLQVLGWAPHPLYGVVSLPLHVHRGAGTEMQRETPRLTVLGCWSHVLPLLSHPSLQPSFRMPFLVCHFVVGNVWQLAAQTSDCFLIFAFSFIYYSSFLLVLDVCKSSSFEMWREHWAWNAWWWWHLGFFCDSVCLNSFVYESGIDEPGGEGCNLWAELYCCHTAEWSWPAAQGSFLFQARSVWERWDADKGRGLIFYFLFFFVYFL